MRTTIVAVLLFTGLTTSFAFAQDPEQTYDFEGDLVEGDLVAPDLDWLTGRRRGDRDTLIRVRRHFVPEIRESVEGL